MKKLILPILVFFSLESFAAFYAEISGVYLMRNFSQASIRKSNAGIEGAQETGAVTAGYMHDENWSGEVEYIANSKFTVNQVSLNGSVKVSSISTSLKYTFGGDWINENWSFFAKGKLSYLEIEGKEVFGDTGSNGGVGIGASGGVNYKINEKYSTFLEGGGIFGRGSLSDYEIYPIQLGIRYIF